MTKLLVVQGNPKKVEESFSLRVADAFVAAYKESNPTAVVETVNLFATEVPEIDADVLSAWGKLAGGVEFTSLTADEQAKVGQMGQLLNQFVEADKIVFATPMFNFTFPGRVKSYLDTLCVAGTTFKYTENGPVGLLEGKKVVHIHGTGGIYSNTNMAYGDAYLRQIMAFIGIKDVETIFVEGTAAMPEKAPEIEAAATEKAKEAGARF
jgi:FMN-dependent NADH-azoreductase